MTESGDSTEEFRSLRLPIRLAATEESRRKDRAGCLRIVAVIALVAGGVLFMATKSIPIGVGTVIFVGAGLSYLYWGRRSRPAPEALPSNVTVEISSSRIRCKDSVDGDADWSELTAFRWVLGGDTEKNRPFKRSNEPNDVAMHQAGEFYVEAAPIENQEQDNPYGYYNGAEIQFELPPIVKGVATRKHADWLVDWLNELQRRARDGELAADEMQRVPVWLNAESVAPIQQLPQAGASAVERTRR